jgi:hypothetical protein
VSIEKLRVLWHTVDQRRNRAALVLAALVMGGACRPPPDEPPPPTDGTRDRLAALQQDLVACCAADSGDKFVAHLKDLSEHQPPDEVTAGLAHALVSAVDGADVNDVRGANVAADLYQIVNGGYLSRRALDDALARLERDLLASGAEASSVDDAKRLGRRAARESRHPRSDWW